MNKKGGIIHVVGTGTIGEPLIGLLCSLRKLGIFDSDVTVTFQKVTPDSRDRFKVNKLKKRGAIFAVAREKTESFIEAGMVPDITQGRALEQADIIVDCTPYGLRRKSEVYLDRVEDTLLFLAQGNAGGFGSRVAWGMNEEAVYNKIHVEGEKFIQVVSCNTHATLSAFKSIALENGNAEIDNLIEMLVVILRRANDISQSNGFIPSPQVGAHDDELHGTHQAADASQLVLEWLGVEPNIRSSVFKMNSQLMHANWFNIRVKRPLTRDDAIDLFKANPYVAVTERDIANEIFSGGRDHGYFGRILNQIVVPIHKKSAEKYPLTVFPNPDGSTSVTGTYFTPQDGNSLLTSVNTCIEAFYRDTWRERTGRILTNEDPQFIVDEI